MRVLASKQLHFVSLTDSFIMLDGKLLKPPSLCRRRQLTGPVNYLDFRETGSRSENGYEFSRSGLKMGVENDIFWSEVGSGFGEPGSTPPPRIPRSTPLLVSIDLVSRWP